MLNPYMVHHRKEYWRLISSGFLHAGFFHLLINMMVLLGFGSIVESYYRGACNYLTKPVTYGDFIDLVDKISQYWTVSIIPYNNS